MAEKTPEDIEFEKKLAQATYKTTYNGIGTQKSARTFSLIQSPTMKNMALMANSPMYIFPITKHLIYSGMYKNASLNTTAEKYRWVNGNKDWMEKLG